MIVLGGKVLGGTYDENWSLGYNRNEFRINVLVRVGRKLASSICYGRTL